MSQAKIEKNKSKIADLLNKNIDLKYNLMLKEAKKFSTKVVNWGTKKNPKMVTLKIMHWLEWFKDEDHPDEKGVRIERQQIIEIDGEKSFHKNVIKYWKPEDIN